MKKISLILIVIVSFFILTGCTNESKKEEIKDSKVPAGLIEVTGKIVKAK